MSPSPERPHYFQHYDSAGRFGSYWTQIGFVLQAGGGPVLEVGIGNQTVSAYLRKVGVDLVTADINPLLRPDVVGSITQLPLADASFGTVMACEVLEHLPFAQFPVGLGELRRVSRRYGIISMPNVGTAWRYELHIPGHGPVRKLVELPWYKRRHSVVGVGEHFWEIEVRGTERPVVERAIRDAGWRILEARRVWEMPVHQFYFLEKT